MKTFFLCKWRPAWPMIAFCFLPLFLAASSSAQVVIDFDSPNFRKLLIAIPEFTVSSDSAGQATQDARESAAYLGEILQFSGIFNVMSAEAYKEIQQKSVATQIGSVDPLAGVDMAQWKALGVECLVLGELKTSDKGPVLEIRAIDINQGKALIGKRFTGSDTAWLQQSLRAFGDQVLEAYTGKPGIFNSKLVFIGQKARKDSKQVFLSDFDGSNLRQLTFDNVPHLSPSFSPDGQSVIYTSYRDGNPDLYIYDLRTSKVRKLAYDKGLNSGGVFAPNGQIVAYAGSVDGNTEIYTMPVTGGGRKMLISGSGLDVSPIFSPDGKQLAFVSGRFERPHIFVAQLQWNGDTTVKVTGETRITYAGWYNATPAWTKDSSRIAFAGYDKDIDRFDLFVVNADASNLERLTLKSGDNEHPHWSPNGYMIMFSSNRVGSSNVKDVHNLHVMNRDGSHQRPLKIGLYSSMTGHWGPNLVRP